MALRAEALATFAFVDHVHRPLESRGPVESVVERLGHQGSGGGMMPTLTLVYVSEDILPLFLFDGALEHASHATPNQLAIDDGVGC